jgi:aerobic-type carbon monoxide dehydrogenase small subunit (CoxS/CutS family)
MSVVDRRITMETSVNGRTVSLRVAPEALLLDVLREELGLTGAKRSCDVQVCGACTVLVEGRPVSACSVLAWEARGRAVRTVEGLADGDRLHPVQEAFLAASALQCGYCTPGMIMAVVALLEESPEAGPAEVKDWLRGNICRCTGYASILDAVTRAQRTMGSRPRP